MEYKILLDRNEKTSQIEAEEQTRFVISVIEALEIPFEWDSNEPFTIFDKVQLRKIFWSFRNNVTKRVIFNHKPIEFKLLKQTLKYTSISNQIPKIIVVYE